MRGKIKTCCFILHRLIFTEIDKKNSRVTMTFMTIGQNAFEKHFMFLSIMQQYFMLLCKKLETKIVKNSPILCL